MLPHVSCGSGRTVVRSAQGALREVKETELVWLRDPEGKSCQMTMLMLPECPVNLLGRDGIAALGLAIVPTPGGLKIIRQAPEQVYVMQGMGQPHYYYTLDVPNKPPVSAGAYLLDEGKRAIEQAQDQMSPDELHVTMWYTEHPDPKYKEKLDSVTPLKITVSYLYSDVTANAAAAVILPESALNLFRVYHGPHISLCKSKDAEWKDLGKLVDTGERAQDWVATGVNTWFSDTTKLSKKALFWTVTVTSGVHLDKGPQ